MWQQQTIEEIKDGFEVYKHLAQSRDDIRLGRIQPAWDIFEEIKCAINDLDLCFFLLSQL